MNPSDLINDIEEIASNLRSEEASSHSVYHTSLLTHIKRSRGNLEAPHLELTQNTFLLKELINDSLKFSYENLWENDFRELESRFAYMPPPIEWKWFEKFPRDFRLFTRSVWHLALEDESESFTQAAIGFFYCAALVDWYLTHFSKYRHAPFCKILLDRILMRLQYWAYFSEHIDQSKHKQPYLLYLGKLTDDKYQQERKNINYPREPLLNAKQFFKVSGFAYVWDEWSKNQLAENDGSGMSLSHLQNEIHFLEVEKVLLDEKGGEIPILRKLDTWQKERLKALKAHLELKMGAKLTEVQTGDDGKPNPQSEANIAKQILYIMAQDAKAFRVFCAAGEAGVRFSADQRKVFGQLESFYGSEPASHELKQRAEFHEIHKVDEMIKELRHKTATNILNRNERGVEGIDTKKPISKSGSVSIDRYVYPDAKAGKGKGGKVESKSHDPKLLKRVVQGLKEASQNKPVQLKHISIFLQNSLAKTLRSDAWYRKVNNAFPDEKVKEAYIEDDDGEYQALGANALPALHERLQPILELYIGEPLKFYIPDGDGGFIERSAHKAHGSYENNNKAEDLAGLLCDILPSISNYCDEWEQGTVRGQLVQTPPKPKKKVAAKKSEEPVDEEPDAAAANVEEVEEVKEPIAEEPDPASSDVGKEVEAPDIQVGVDLDDQGGSDEESSPEDPEPAAEESDSAPPDNRKVEKPKKKKKKRVEAISEMMQRRIDMGL